MAPIGEHGRPSRIFEGLPPHGRGLRIGLFGGTFNPPHDGHRLVALTALQRLGLDAVWWLVTPGNPLKDNKHLPTQTDRLQAVAAVAAHPRFFISGIERQYRTRYTAEFLQRLNQRVPGTRFVWIMGADSLADFHHWHHWRDIAATLPIAVVNRPGSLIAPLSAPAARAMADWRLPADKARSLVYCPPPAWIFLSEPRSTLSSTDIRALDAFDCD